MVVSSINGRRPRALRENIYRLASEPAYEAGPLAGSHSDNRERFLGRCFDYLPLGELAGTIPDTLHSLGYFGATVSEPSMTIADSTRHLQPVVLRVRIDEGWRYRVVGTDLWNLIKARFARASSLRFTD